MPPDGTLTQPKLGKTETFTVTDTASVGTGPATLAVAKDGSIWVASVATGSLQRVVRARGAWRPQAGSDDVVCLCGARGDTAARPVRGRWVGARRDRPQLDPSGR